MLLRFGLQNHLSVETKQELSFLVSWLHDDRTALIPCPAAPRGWLLPTVVVYGANASGKSNLLAGLAWMRSAVLFSHSRGEPGAGVLRAPFGLDPRATQAPSVFDIDFVLDGVRYHYGFEASDEAFTAEWLHCFPNERQQLLFQRDGLRFQFGRGLKGRSRVIADLTRPNSLFVAAAAQNGHDVLGKVSEFFRRLRVHTEAAEGPGLNALRRSRQIDPRVIEVLERLSTGIVGYRVLEHQAPQGSKELFSGLKSLLEKFGGEQWDSDLPASSLQLAHRDCNNDLVYFALDQESQGTRRLLVLLGLVFQALDQGSPLFIDELDASLHTLACEAIFGLFSSRAHNPHGAQIIATTHDTNLLRVPGLRRDEVWFAEKSAEGATRIYPLTDLPTRKGDNMERGYLLGRYGAVPFSGPLPDILAVEPPSTVEAATGATAAPLAVASA